MCGFPLILVIRSRELNSRTCTLGIVVGTIYLGGGGGALDEAAVWRRMLKGKSRLVYWPFALEPERALAATEWLTRSLRNLDLHIQVETWTDLATRNPEQLESAELLFVGGGNTFRLLHHVRQHGFLDAVREFVESGGTYYGGSAGALLACANVEIALGLDQNEVDLTDLSALGLLKSFDVLPHFTPTQLADTRDWSSQHGRVVLGIPERSGLALGEGTAEVLGTEPVSEVSEDEVTVHRPGTHWVWSTG